MNSPPLQNNINTNNTNNTNGLLNEEVTTIFVVGFPEDMQEREFQNMFMFSPGFEAASLKWHCKDQDDDSATTINPTLNGKKQMIGFARFRTRLEALEAVEVISGKKVDQEKGFTLKAEMAKKNLHVKRGSIAPTSNNNSSNSSNNNTKKLMFGHHEPFTFSPLPSDLLSPMTDYKSDPFALAAEHQPSTMTPTTPVFNDHVFGFRSYSIDGRNTTNTITTTTTTTIPEDMSLDPFNYLSKSSPMPIERNTHPYFIDDHTINNHFNHPHPHQLHSEFPSLASSQRSNTDQNPPCNTLYVGNLPPNTNEDELRQLFSKCNGYKRMYFRTKPQGPMCFVEFENVMYASQTMGELQGQTLSNSIKGGIRLSFSKNPLFTKPNKTTSSAFDQQQTNQRTLLSSQLNFDPQL
ncbi:hypothetical protein BJ944DRAFT_165664 [Cunninghamella echinulata]|nr:hypothetical protein BJ944DRAFT_165664 [Cunninghamella echinulata]